MLKVCNFTFFSFRVTMDSRKEHQTPTPKRIRGGEKMSDYVVENRNVRQNEKSEIGTRSWLLPVVLVAAAAANLMLAYIF